MSRSLIGGLINNGVKIERLLATDPDAEQRQNITQQFGITALENNEEAVANADVIVLAVKPRSCIRLLVGWPMP